MPEHRPGLSDTRPVRWGTMRKNTFRHPLFRRAVAFSKRGLTLMLRADGYEKNSDGVGCPTRSEGQMKGKGND